jgi:hypothetical protein
MEAVDAAPKGRKKKDAPAVPGSEAAAPPAEEKKGLITVGDITIEMLREMATKYSSAFGMPKLLELNLKHGGVKKLKDLDKGIYGVLYGAMSDELAKAATPAPEGAGAVTNGKPPEGITKGQAPGSRRAVHRREWGARSPRSPQGVRVHTRSPRWRRRSTGVLGSDLECLSTWTEPSSSIPPS